MKFQAFAKVYLGPMFFCDATCSSLVVGYLCFGTTFQSLLQDQQVQEVSVLTVYSCIKCLCIHSVPLSGDLVPTVYSHIKPICCVYSRIWCVCAYCLMPHKMCL